MDNVNLKIETTVQSPIIKIDSLSQSSNINVEQNVTDVTIKVETSEQSPTILVEENITNVTLGVSRGYNGKSAYEIAVLNGFVGTEQEWLISIGGTNDHTFLLNIGVYTHEDIDTHIADDSIHFTQSEISVSAAQISDFDTEVSNNSSVAANTAKIGITTQQAEDIVQLGIMLNAIVQDKHYIHSQGIPESVWNISHGLNKYPTIAVVDSAKTVVEGVIVYTDTNNCTISFNGGFTGEAYCN